MPSPFPGMDPYVEPQKWRDFHGRFVTDIADALTPLVRPAFLVEYDQHVFVTHDADVPDRLILPDVTITADTERAEEVGGAGSSTVATLAPVRVLLPAPTEHRQAFLRIRDAETLDVVTVIELLSPDNKGAGGDGRGRYLAKRDEILQSSTHLVEIDLLRGGRRMPTVRSMPRCDYCVLVSRAQTRPEAEAYCWTLRENMRNIPIPLRGGASDATLSLQNLFAARYDRSGYDYSLKYDRPLDPPLSASDAEWVRSILGGRTAPTG